MSILRLEHRYNVVDALQKASRRQGERQGDSETKRNLFNGALDYIREETGRFLVQEWNDDPDTTLMEIIRVLEKAACQARIAERLAIHA